MALDAALTPRIQIRKLNAFIVAFDLALTECFPILMGTPLIVDNILFEVNLANERTSLIFLIRLLTAWDQGTGPHVGILYVYITTFQFILYVYAG